MRRRDRDSARRHGGRHIREHSGARHNGVHPHRVHPMSERPEVAAGNALAGRGLKLAVAESCTGGMLSSAITDVPGSSRWFKGGVVAYTNEVKKSLLGVRAATLKKYGAVSHQTATEMASGVRKKLGGDVGISVTGIAGPIGQPTGLAGQPAGPAGEKPVGTVFIAISYGKRVYTKRLLLAGGRRTIKKNAAKEALIALAGILPETRTHD
ncbi:MAG: nicotinamide-nucleotide amidohydrolase family protein [Deltaproteobacteria bacterium]|nr:nicotinamide-nucleotide amidohydrolase family protein [Deltaproteobacteria bacterium]